MNAIATREVSCAPAGHADIKTTQKSYLSVQDEDVIKSRRLQQEIVGGLKVTDPNVTHRACKRSFLGRKSTV